VLSDIVKKHSFDRPLWGGSEPRVLGPGVTDWQGVTALSLNEMRSKLVFLEIASIRGVVSQNTPLSAKSARIYGR